MLLIIVSLFNPAGWLGTGFQVIRAIQLAGAAYSGYQAYQAGDVVGVVTAAAAAAGIGARALSGWCATTSLVGRFAGGAGNTVLTGLAAANVFFNLKSAYQEFTSPNGDPIKGVLDLLLAGVDAYNVAKFLASSCFTGEMLLDAEGGKKRADAIMVGDKLWSRDEFDPTGPIELKEVEDVFTRVAPIWNVHVAGQTLRTTAEHPFYVLGRGWIPAKMLAMGEVLLTRDGQRVSVEGVSDSGAVETVNNSDHVLPKRPFECYA